MIAQGLVAALSLIACGTESSEEKAGVFGGTELINTLSTSVPRRFTEFQSVAMPSSDDPIEHADPAFRAAIEARINADPQLAGVVSVDPTLRASKGPIAETLGAEAS